MKIIYNKIIPFKGYIAMNICGILFARQEFKPLNKITINHEKIHTEQIKELYYIGFYILYLFEYISNIIKYGNLSKAYRNISFEKEAYNHEKDLNYIYERKKYNYFKWKK